MNHRKNGTVKGLPARENLIGLARTFLQEQCQHWAGTELAALSPKPSKKVLQRMADDFTEAYVAGDVPVSPSMRLTETAVDLGAAYTRFSDDASNPRSLDQQLINILRKARELNILIPWVRVFADAGIPGTTAQRPGYQHVRTLACSAGGGISVLLVDDLSRLNRDQVESLTVGKLAEHHGVRIVGASDGFDSNGKMSKMMHSFAAMTHESFSDNLSEKVKRGERDAFRQGRNTGALPLGYEVVPLLDDKGKLIKKGKKGHVSKVVIDEEGAEIVRRIFKMYAIDKLSPEKIARAMNGEMAAGRSTWTDSGIRSMLKNPRYRGDIYWGRNKNVVDPITGKKKAVPHDAPPLHRHDESMRIVDEQLWAARERREKQVSRDTASMRGKNSSRQSQYPTRLFDLRCGYCGKPLRLYRSHGKYESMVCPNGKRRKPDCQLITSKMLKIIDEAILAHLQEQLLADGLLEELCDKANQFLAEEAKRPQVDMEALNRKIASLQTKIKRQADRLGDLDDDGIAAKQLVAKIHASEQEHDRLVQERTAAKTHTKAIKPIDLKSFVELLADLRGLLQDDVTVAHGALAKALGPVAMTQGEKIGRSTTWFAKLEIDPVPVLLEVSRHKKNCPSTQTLEFLCLCSWTSSIEVECCVFEVRRLHRVAATAKSLHDKGTTVGALGNYLHMCQRDVKAAIRFAVEHPDEARRYSGEPDHKIHPNAKYLRISEKVYRMYQSGNSLGEITKKLGYSFATIQCAYDHADRTAIDQAVAEGTRPVRNRHPRVDPEVIVKIHELLREGASNRSIAKKFGMCKGTIARIKREMLAEPPA